MLQTGAAQLSSQYEHWLTGGRELAGSWKNWGADLSAARALLLGLPRAGQQDNSEEKETLLLKSILKVLAEAALFLTWKLKVLSLFSDVFGNLEGR